jgi:hypothetical protein
MSKKFCVKCGKRKARSQFIKNSAICNDCKAPRAYDDENPPACECGGKVVNAAKLNSAGQSLHNGRIWLCCSCGKTLGDYEDTTLTPMQLLKAMYSDSKYNELSKNVHTS